MGCRTPDLPGFPLTGLSKTEPAAAQGSSGNTMPNCEKLSMVSPELLVALARWCAQYSASTTARSLQGVRSWGTGPDGLTQATLLTQTRAPSGERLRFFSKQTFDARFQKILDHLVVLLQVVLF